MTRPNITAGKWHIGKRAGADNGAIYGEKGEEIALPLGFFMEDSEATANAQAIAAVPGLLNALEKLFKRLQAIEVSKRWHEKPEEMDEAEFIRLICEEVAERGFLLEARAALIAAGYQF